MEHKFRKWTMASKSRMTQIVPGLFLGNAEASYDRDMLRQNGINAIVSLGSSQRKAWVTTTREAGVLEHRHKWVRCKDSPTQNLLVYMSEICDFIDQMASPTLSSSSFLPAEHKHKSNDSHGAPSKAILVHCTAGMSRSPTIIAAYLMRKYRITRQDALTFIQSKQLIKPSTNFTRQLQIWEDVGYQVWENKARTVAKALYTAFLNDQVLALERNARERLVMDQLLARQRL